MTFDSNGGSAIPSQDIVEGGKVTRPADPTLADLFFVGWYSDEDMTDAWHFDIDTVTSAMTLHAKWTKLTFASSVPDGKILSDGHITLTPNIAGGTWTFDSTYLSRDGNTFVGLKAGTTTVTYTAEGESTSYDLTIYPALALTSSPADGKVFVGGRITLTPNVGGGTWSWDAAYFSSS